MACFKKKTWHVFKTDDLYSVLIEYVDESNIKFSWKFTCLVWLFACLIPTLANEQEEAGLHLLFLIIVPLEFSVMPNKYLVGML